jgi:hypothetical protein
MAATRCRSYVCRLAFVWHPRIPDDRMPLPFPAGYPSLSCCAEYVRTFHCPLLAGSRPTGGRTSCAVCENATWDSSPRRCRHHCLASRKWSHSGTAYSSPFDRRCYQTLGLRFLNEFSRVRRA